jgi:gliding motility-associated-like protein
LVIHTLMRWSFLLCLWGISLSPALTQPAPVAHYPFDGNARDVSGNDNHGTPMGASLSPDRRGQPNRAFAFDGVDDYLTYLNASNFQPELPVTLAVWVKLSSYRAQTIFTNDWQENVYLGIELQCQPDGTLYAGYGDGGSIGPAAHRIKVGNTPMALNTWYHVAVVIRGPTDMSLYLNGRAECGTYGGLGQDLSYTGSDGRSGQRDQTSLVNSPLVYFHGSLDDLRLYDQALSVADIRALIGSDGPEPLGADTAICIFDTLQLPTPTAERYQWTPATGLNCDTCASPRFFPRRSTTYQLQVNTETGCADTFDYRIQVNDCCRTLALASITPSAPSCATENDGTLRASAQGGSPPYAFSLNGGPWQNQGVFTALTGGRYRLRLRDAAGCLRDTLVEVVAPLPLRIIVDSLGQVNCAGDPTGGIFITPQGGTSPYRYQVDGQLRSTLAHTGLAVADYALHLLDANDCEVRDTVRITGEDGLFTEVSDLQGPLCANVASGTLTARSQGGISPYEYAVAGGAFRPGSTVTGWPMGSSELITRDGQGCIIRQMVSMPQMNTLEAWAEVAQPGQAGPWLRSQAQIQFRNRSQAATYYEWDFGYEGQRSQAQHPSFTYPEAGHYQVVLTAWDATLSCEDRDTLLIEVVPDGQLFLPNAFTPNGDGHNDAFVIGGEGISSAELVIYSRWGRELTRRQGWPLAWDGRTDGGESVPAGVYAYRLQATFNDGQQTIRTGTVTLLR